MIRYLMSHSAFSRLGYKGSLLNSCLNKYLILIIALSLFASASAKPTKAEADTLYSHHIYDKALLCYEQLLKEYPQDANLLYNIGNCHYRLKDIAHAILFYERAAKLNPSDPDVRHNLTLARSQTQDKFYSASDLDVVYSFNSFVDSFGSDGWAWLSVVAFAVLLAGVLLLRFSSKPLVHRLAYVGFLLGFFCVALFNIFAYVQRHKFSDANHAIVINTTKMMSTPDTTSTNIFTLHGGSKVLLNDTTIKDWSEVILSDGQQGWVVNADIERI